MKIIDIFVIIVVSLFFLNAFIDMRIRSFFSPRPTICSYCHSTVVPPPVVPSTAATTPVSPQKENFESDLDTSQDDEVFKVAQGMLKEYNMTLADDWSKYNYTIFDDSNESSGFPYKSAFAYGQDHYYSFNKDLSN